MSEPGPLPVWLELSEAGAATSTPQRLKLRQVADAAVTPNPRAATSHRHNDRPGPRCCPGHCTSKDKHGSLHLRPQPSRKPQG